MVFVERGVPARVRLTARDEWFLHNPSPAYIHFEVRVAGHLCPERLASAVAATARRHPLARARIRRGTALTTRHQWEIPEEPGEVRLEVADCRGGDERGVLRARARRYAVTAAVDLSPPFALTLVHREGGDHLMLNVSHTFGDGISAYRLMVSILSSYAGVAEPASPVSPLGARDFGRNSTAYGQANRKTAGLRVAPAPGVRESGSSEDTGVEGIQLIRLGQEGTRSVLARRQPPSTVNDLLLAALSVAIRRWNAAHGAEQGPISLVVPVNLRPAHWRHDGLGNIATGAMIVIPPTVPAAMEPMVEEVSRQTALIRGDRAARSPIDPPAVTSWFPSAVKKVLAAWGRRWRLLSITSVLSNLGVLDWPDLGPSAPAVREVWFSPPVPTETVSLGAVSSRAELFVSLRYNRSHFSTAAAAEFALLYLEILTGS